MGFDTRPGLGFRVFSGLGFRVSANWAFGVDINSRVSTCRTIEVKQVSTTCLRVSQLGLPYFSNVSHDLLAEPDNLKA